MRATGASYSPVLRATQVFRECARCGKADVLTVEGHWWVMRAKDREGERRRAKRKSFSPQSYSLYKTIRNDKVLRLRSLRSRGQEYVS